MTKDLNLWIRDLRFKLNYLSDIPKHVLPGHFLTIFDDKSGYQHVRRQKSTLDLNEKYFLRVSYPAFWLEGERLISVLSSRTLLARLEFPYHNISTTVM